jgi:hypothetical protein
VAQPLRIALQKFQAKPTAALLPMDKGVHLTVTSVTGRWTLFYLELRPARLKATGINARENNEIKLPQSWAHPHLAQRISLFRS